MEKRFAITGATGLLGSNLVNRLVEMNIEVSVLIKDENSKSILTKNVTRIYGDISDKHDIEFFIQKAIGWSLRQYSKFNPEAVREFVIEINLQGLAKREASKYS